VVAIGETGLDYHYDNSPRDRQRASLAAHLEMGRRLTLPVVVHCREADDDLSTLLRSSGGGTTGVLHCFSSGRALLEQALGMGWYVSFAGMITFSKYADADLIRLVPVDRILVETDSPYLSPVPLRGRRNEPAHVVHTARRAAELRGEEPEEFIAHTVRNARALFKLPAD
jgi:TatD DNase family protein